MNMTPLATAFLKDGSQVQSTSISTCIAAVATAGGGKVIVSPGEWVLPAGINVPSNITIEGAGYSTHITAPNIATGDNIFLVDGVSSVSIRDLRLDGTDLLAPNQDTYPIKLISANDVEISGCYIENAPEDGIRVGPPINLGNCDSIRIINNYFYNAGTIGPSGSFIGATSVTKLVISNNVGTKCVLDAIDIEPDTGGTPPTGAQAFDVVITGNNFDGAGSQSNGISLFCTPRGSASRAVIAANNITGFVGGAGIVVEGGFSAVSVIGNVVSFCDMGVNVRGTSFITVGQNVLNQNTLQIYSDASNGNSFTANTMFGGTGISEVNSSGGNDYVGNKFIGSTVPFSSTNPPASTSVIFGSDNNDGGMNFVVEGQTVGMTVRNSTVSSPALFRFLPSATVGAWNGLVNAGDCALIYTDGVNNEGSLVIGPVTTSAKGLRIDSSGAVTCYNGLLQQIAGPASSTAIGTRGQIAWDANYIYVCVDTNSWKRVTLASY